MDEDLSSFFSIITWGRILLPDETGPRARTSWQRITAREASLPLGVWACAILSVERGGEFSHSTPRAPHPLLFMGATAFP